VGHRARTLTTTLDSEHIQLLIQTIIGKYRVKVKQLLKIMFNRLQIQL
jgi:hypothetical protein